MIQLTCGIATAQQESFFQYGGSLHQAAASSVFRFHYCKTLARIDGSLRHPAKNRRQHPGPTQALTVRGRNVLSADCSATDVSRAHSAGPRPLLTEGRKRESLIVFACCPMPPLPRNAFHLSTCAQATQRASSPPPRGLALVQCSSKVSNPSCATPSPS